MRSRIATTLAALLPVTLASFTVAFLYPVPPAAARTWNVPGEVPTIQAAIDSAIAEDSVLVAPGTYSESPKPTVLGPSMLIMKFGVVLLSSGGAAVTTLDAQGQGRVVFYSFCSQELGEARIEGLTITGGSAYGAVFCEAGRLTIADCAITGNSTLGVIARDCSETHLISCSVTGNSGGGVALLPSDIGSPALTVLSSEISDNVGHGIKCDGDGAILGVQGSSVSRNSGNGIQIGDFDSGSIIDCTIVGNHQAGIEFGGIYQIARTIVSHTTLGPGLQCGFSEDPFITCCDVWGNAGGDGFCGTSGGGNFSLNPLFCDVDGGDYTLRANSPCLPGNHPQNEPCGLIGAFGAGCDSFPTSVGSPGGAPAAVVALGAPAPNPSDRGFAFEVRLAEGGAARMRVYDAGGRLVRALWDGALDGGAHPLSWDARDERGLPVASGVYTLRLEAGDRIQTRKVSVIR